MSVDKLELSPEEWKDIVFALDLTEEWHWSLNPKYAEQLKALSTKIKEAKQ